MHVMYMCAFVYVHVCSYVFVYMCVCVFMYVCVIVCVLGVEAGQIPAFPLLYLIVKHFAEI